ncbi:MAG: Stp1/IreP family PP2C-type Ser/Thr phosphatase [Gammaproteobacteria bacterium]|nr:Stp1/IreP family PP2C-type Ser/Thr phosphatase [Gammaproteobacteria bacterium]
MIGAGKTDVGVVRSVNQDRFAVREELGLAILADGMGGAKDGDVAAEMAVEATIEHLGEIIHERPVEADDLRAAATLANRRVYDYANEDPSRFGMGTTLVIVVFDGQRALVGNLGDSRCYLFTKGILVQVTTDHSVVQRLVDNGEISFAEARNHPERHVLSTAIGVEPRVQMDVSTLYLNDDERLMMCSDGLSDLVDDKQIAMNLRAWGSNAERGVERLVDAAKAAGGRDNVTVVLVGP